MNNFKDVPETGMCVISFLFPIIGIIYYIAKHTSEPTSCGTYLKWTLISILVSVVSGIFSGILM